MLKVTTIAMFAALLATPAFAQQSSTEAQSAPPPVVSQVPANNGVTILSCGLLTPCHDGATGG
ncbi:MAG TPA: hypothetical protein VK558_07070 [Patescibacteria group bacterium]|nr:hypothetical protein [Patescibacteria group bacterium]